MDKNTCQQFPLFAHLKNEIPNDSTSLSVSRRIELVEKIKDLNDQGCSLVYALIRYYQLYETDENAVEVPFGMKKTKHGYRFCIEDIPPLLQNLIARFVEVHLKTQQEITSIK